MNKALENYINELEVKLNIKFAAENMGFIKEDRDYYIKKEVYKIHLLFKEDHLIIWVDDRIERAIVKNYLKLYNEIDRGICTPKEFLYRALNSF